MCTSLLCVYNHCQRLQLVAKPSNFKGVVFSEGFRKQHFLSLQSKVSTYCAKGNMKFLKVYGINCGLPLQSKHRLFAMFYTAQT